MPKRKIKRIKSGKSFVKITNTAFLTESQGRPIFEEEVTTFKVTKKDNKFIVYEIPRKSNPIRRKTIKAKKKETISDVIKRLDGNDIKINRKRTTVYRSGKSSHQTNYRAKIKGTVQVAGLVQVEDIKRFIGDHFIGWSQKFLNSNNIDMDKAKSQIIAMAIFRFIDTYGAGAKSGDIVADIIRIRYLYRSQKIRDI